MKRWLVALLVLLAAIVLVSPGIIGRLAEDNLELALPGAMTDDEGNYVVTRERFERGWFTTEGRHRIEIRHGRVHDLLVALAGLEPDVVPVLIVETRMDHGLVPVTSMSRESGSLMPNLASSVSTMTLDLGTGDPVAIPGKLYSNIGLTGDTASRYLLESGSFEGEGVAAHWDGADVSFTIDATGRSAGYAGRILPFSVRSNGAMLRADGLRFEGDIEKTGVGLHVGSLALESGGASGSTDSFGQVAAEDLALRMQSGLDDDGRLQGTANLSLTGLDLPQDDAPVDLELDLTLDRLHARALGALIAELRRAQARASRGEAAGTAPAAVEAALQRFLSAGGELSVDRLEVVLPQGELASALRFELPETEGAEAYAWASLLLALSATADVELSAALVDHLLATRPDMQSLLATGILERREDVYVMEAKYAQGVVTVNGAPLPVPLPGREMPAPR